MPAQLSPDSDDPEVRFWWWIAEREAIRLRRAWGCPRPWTLDLALAKYRFCNVFREDDATTVWFRENVREPLMADDSLGLETLLFATFAFRRFNRRRTGMALWRAGLLTSWDTDHAKEVLVALGPPYVTGAYKISGQRGMKKHEALCEQVGEFAEAAPAVLAAIVAHTPRTLQGAWRELRQFPHVGGFTAYEVTTDLRHTPVLWNPDGLRQPADVNTWAHAGPGARRGLNRLWRPEQPAEASLGQRQALLEMNALRTLASKALPRWMEPLELREIEHSLCEFDKWERARLGVHRPRRVWRPGDAGVL